MTTIENRVGFFKRFFWEMKSPLSTNRRKEIGIFRFFVLFSKMWKRGERYKVERIGESTEFWPTSTLQEKKDEVNSFYLY